MITLNYLYNGKASLEAVLEQDGFDFGSECLVRIYTSIFSKEEAVAAAKEIKDLLPNAHIFGASGCGIIYQGKQYPQETLIVIEKSKHTRIETNIITYRGKTAAETAAEVAAQLECGMTQGREAAFMHLICGAHYPDVHNFVEEFRTYYPHMKMAGGIAGDILPLNIEGYVFTDSGVLEQGIVTAVYYNESLHVYQGVNIAHEPISPVYRLNRCDGSLLITIEGRPAEEWCKEQLGIETLSVYDDWQAIADNDVLIRFPIVLETHGGASRFIKYEPAARKISLYFCEIPDDTLFRIGYVSPMKCVAESYAICGEIEKHPVESLFCYTCLFRKLYLQNCAEWELRPFADLGVCGVFMMGEISNVGGKTEFLNGSCCLLGVAEKQKYIHPDFSVFADLYQMKDDNESLLHFVLKRQSEVMSQENKVLIEKLMQQQQLVQNQIFTDPNTGMPNSIKYAQDDQALCFNKLCLIAVENADLLISRLKKESYYQILSDFCIRLNQYCQEWQESSEIYCYVINETMIAVAANDKIGENDFLKMVNALYGEFQCVRLEYKNELIINRFVLVLNQNDLLEKAFGTIKSSASLQTNFLVWESSVESGETFENEMNMIGILKQAIEEGRIIPYFQGIYNNHTGQINKYEALMRIEDSQGRLYVPADFMDIAKKYHLYSEISKLMIEQVFTLFTGREEVVSINLSAYDINSYTACKMIFHRLEETGRADNFVFEILEDEKFRDIELLRNFIDRVRTYGVKIAIDDFGRGYSNFMQIAKMDPDYIKVDGSIIREIPENVLNKKVSKNIVFLGNQLNAELVAEFVENDRIQASVKELGMHFSQGYYFAKPLPFGELGI